VVAAAAGCINVLLTCPLWVVITQMQAAQKSRGPGGARRAEQCSGSAAAAAAGGATATADGAEAEGSGKPEAVAGASGGSSNAQYDPKDAGAVRTAMRLYRDRGLAGFYQGLRPSLVMVVNPTIQVCWWSVWVGVCEWGRLLCLGLVENGVAVVVVMNWCRCLYYCSQERPANPL